MWAFPTHVLTFGVVCVCLCVGHVRDASWGRFIGPYMHTHTYTQIYIAPKIVRTNLRRWHRVTRRQRQTGRDVYAQKYRQTVRGNPRKKNNYVLNRGAHWRNLANTTVRSACGGDAALCHITSTTCFCSAFSSGILQAFRAPTAPY